MTSSHGALVIIGSGPGIGRNVGALFAERGFNKIILMSRNEDRLKEDAAFVTSAAPNATVDIVTIDLADAGSVQTALSAVDKKLEGTPLECVLFNAARLAVSPILEFSSEELEVDLKVCFGRRRLDQISIIECMYTDWFFRSPLYTCTNAPNGRCLSSSRSRTLISLLSL